MGAAVRMLAVRALLLFTSVFVFTCSGSMALASSMTAGAQQLVQQPASSSTLGLPPAPGDVFTCAGPGLSSWCSTDNVQSAFEGPECMQMAMPSLQRVVLARDTIWTDDIRHDDEVRVRAVISSHQRPCGVMTPEDVGVFVGPAAA